MVVMLSRGFGSWWGVVGRRGEEEALNVVEFFYDGLVEMVFVFC